jgi:hypothetical protein
MAQQEENIARGDVKNLSKDVPRSDQLLAARLVFVQVSGS